VRDAAASAVVACDGTAGDGAAGDGAAGEELLRRCPSPARGRAQGRGLGVLMRCLKIGWAAVEGRGPAHLAVAMAGCHGQHDLRIICTTAG
jgi:hypothetical protein